MIFDIRTTVLLSVISSITCTIFIFQLWKNNRSRYAGLEFLFIDFVLQTFAMILILLRGAIPDWVSIIASNFMVITGCIAGYTGLLKFVERKNSQVLNYITLAVFMAVHTYYTYGYNSLEYRNLNFSIALFIICFQCGWLLLFQVSPVIKPLTLWAGLTYTAYCLSCVVRLAQFFFHLSRGNDLFYSGMFQEIVMIVYMVLFQLLTYSFVMMVNRRLLMEITLQEEKFSKAFHSAPYAISLTRMSDGTIFDINESFTSITGFDRDEIIGRKTMDLHMFSDNNDRAAIVKSLTEDGRVQGYDLNYRKKNGEHAIGHLTAEKLNVNGEMCIIASIADITERKRAEERIKKLLDEKEIILKEVHHRIKNNMNTIYGLLNLHTERITEPAAIAALEDAGSRVQSMMILYDKLYRSENVNEVGAGVYINDLIEQIVENFPGRIPVKVETHVEDFILDVKFLSPLGIIINELITNIMKYAFTGRESGTIDISASLKDNTVTLAIQDDGVGMPESVSLENSKGFGLTLVKLLSGQIHGSIRIERDSGTRFVMEFPL